MGKKANAKRKEFFEELARRDHLKLVESVAIERVETRGGQRDPLVISSAEFRPVVEEWIQDFDYRQDHFNNVNDDVAPIGPMQYLAYWSNIPQRSIRRMLFEQKWITLGAADALLVAMGMPHRLQTLTIVPNPHWSNERWLRWQRDNGHC